jgi:hypothetical protein
MQQSGWETDHNTVYSISLYSRAHAQYAWHMQAPNAQAH